jgi:hypothetical protein
MKLRWLLLSIGLVCASCAPPPAAPPPAPPAGPPPPSGAGGFGTVKLFLLGSDQSDKQLQPTEVGKLSNVVLLVQQTGDRNERACHAILGAIPQGTGFPAFYELPIWWLDTRTQDQLKSITEIPCNTDFINHYNWPLAIELINANRLVDPNKPDAPPGRGPYLLTMTKGSNGVITGWAIDCSQLELSKVGSVAGEWANNIYAGITDPQKVKDAILASTQGKKPDPNATTDSTTLWSKLFPELWMWLQSHGAQIATVALQIFKWAVPALV